MICVTGGTGFIGSNLVRLLLSGGERVRLLVRPGYRALGSLNHLWRPPDAGRGGPRGWGTDLAGRHAGDVGINAPDRAADALDRMTNGSDRAAILLDDLSDRIEIVWGDVNDREAVNRLAEGAQIIYHLAAVARAWSRDPEKFYRVNVEGTANVLEAARACRVSRVVHVSTELVDGDSTPYQRSKRGAEALVRRYVAEGGEAVIVRPTRVYGPGLLNQANSVTRLIDLYLRGRFRLRLADSGARGNYVYVEDLVGGIVLAADRGGNGEVYVLGGDNATVPELFDAVATAAGKRYALLPLPVPMAKAVAGLTELLGYLGLEPPVTRAWIDVLVADRPMSWEKAARELGYAPRPLRAGVEATVRWLEKTRGYRR